MGVKEVLDGYLTEEHPTRRALVEALLVKHNGSIQEAAHAVGLTLDALRSWIRAHDMGQLPAEIREQTKRKNQLPDYPFASATEGESDVRGTPAREQGEVRTGGGQEGDSGGAPLGGSECGDRSE